MTLLHALPSLELLNAASNRHTPIIAKSPASHVRSTARHASTTVRQPPRPPVTPNDWRPNKSHGSAHQLNSGNGGGSSGAGHSTTTSRESLSAGTHRTPPQRRSDGDVVVYAISGNRRSLSKKSSSHGSVHSGGGVGGGSRLSIGSASGGDGARTPAQRAQSLSDSRRSSINERKERTTPPSPRSTNATRRSASAIPVPTSPYSLQPQRRDEDAESELSFVDDDFKRMVDRLGAEELTFGSGADNDDNGRDGALDPGHADLGDETHEGLDERDEAGNSVQRNEYGAHDARNGANNNNRDVPLANGREHGDAGSYAGSITGYSDNISHASLDRDLQHVFSDSLDQKHHFLSTPTLDLLDAEFGRDNDDELDFGDEDFNFGANDSTGGLEDLDLTGLGPPLSKDNTRPSSPAWTAEERAGSETTHSVPYSSAQGSRQTLDAAENGARADEVEQQDAMWEDRAGSVTTRSAPYSSAHGSRRTLAESGGAAPADEFEQNDAMWDERGGSVTTRSAPYSSAHGSRRTLAESGGAAPTDEFEQVDEAMWDSPAAATPTPATYGRASAHGSRRSLNELNDLAPEEDSELEEPMWDSPDVATPTPAGYGRRRVSRHESLPSETEERRESVYQNQPDLADDGQYPDDHLKGDSLESSLGVLSDSGASDLGTAQREDHDHHQHHHLPPSTSPSEREFLTRHSSRLAGDSQTQLVEDGASEREFRSRHSSRLAGDSRTQLVQDGASELDFHSRRSSHLAGDSQIQLVGDGNDDHEYEHQNAPMLESDAPPMDDRHYDDAPDDGQQQFEQEREDAAYHSPYESENDVVGRDADEARSLRALNERLMRNLEELRGDLEAALHEKDRVQEALRLDYEAKLADRDEDESERYRDLHQKLALAEQELARARDGQDQISAIRASLQQEKELDILGIRKELAAQKERELHELRRAMTLERAAAAEEVERAREEGEKARSDLGRLRKLLKQKDEEARELEERLYTRSARPPPPETDDFSQQYDAAEQEDHAVVVAVEALEAQVAALSKELKQLEASKKRDLQALQIELDQQRARARGKLVSMRGISKSLEEETKAMRAEIAELKAQHARERESFSKQIERERARSRAVLAQGAEKLETETGALRREHQREVRALKDELERERAAAAAAQTAAAATGKASSSGEDNVQHRQQLATLRTSYERKMREMSEKMEKEKARHARDMRALEDEHEKSHSRLRAALDAKQELTTAQSTGDNETATLREQAEKAASEADRLKGDLETLKAEHERKVAALQQEIDKAKAAVPKSRTSVVVDDTQQRELDILRGELKKQRELVEKERLRALGAEARAKEADALALEVESLRSAHERKEAQLTAAVEKERARGHAVLDAANERRQEIETLKATHKRELRALQDEVQKEHARSRGVTEKGTAARRREIDSLKARHEREVQKLKDEIAAERAQNADKADDARRREANAVAARHEREARKLREQLDAERFRAQDLASQIRELEDRERRRADEEQTEPTPEEVLARYPAQADAIRRQALAAHQQRQQRLDSSLTVTELCSRFPEQVGAVRSEQARNERHRLTVSELRARYPEQIETIRKEILAATYTRAKSSTSPTRNSDTANTARRHFEAELRRARLEHEAELERLEERHAAELDRAFRRSASVHERHHMRVEVEEFTAPAQTDSMLVDGVRDRRSLSPTRTHRSIEITEITRGAEDANDDDAEERRDYAPRYWSRSRSPRRRRPLVDRLDSRPAVDEPPRDDDDRVSLQARVAQLEHSKRTLEASLAKAAQQLHDAERSRSRDFEKTLEKAKVKYLDTLKQMRDDLAKSKRVGAEAMKQEWKRRREKLDEEWKKLEEVRQQHFTPSGPSTASQPRTRPTSAINSPPAPRRLYSGATATRRPVADSKVAWKPAGRGY
ncbi:hypothetical protein HDU86_002282 [Geranomyces michiganensis]|nr:hypothetical protein HDU86_002282 [Geranomyces michiganensis]